MNFIIPHLSESEIIAGNYWFENSYKRIDGGRRWCETYIGWAYTPWGAGDGRRRILPVGMVGGISAATHSSSSSVTRHSSDAARQRTHQFEQRFAKRNKVYAAQLKLKMIRDKTSNQKPFTPNSTSRKVERYRSRRF